jgi:hypothetical protein
LRHYLAVKLFFGNRYIRRTDNKTIHAMACPDGLPYPKSQMRWP